MTAPLAHLPGGGTRSVTTAIWRAGAVPGAVVGVVVTAAGLVRGGPGVLGAVVGSLLALAALSVPVLVVRATATASPPAVMGAALGGYGVCVLALAGAWTGLVGRSWLSGTFLAAALFAVTTAWMAGQVRGLLRLRVLAFGAPVDDPGTRDDVPGHGEDRGR